MNFLETFNHNGWELYIYEEKMIPNLKGVDKYFIGRCGDILFYMSSDDKSLIIERFKKAIGNRTNYIGDKDKKILELQKEIVYLNQKLESIKNIVEEM